MQETCAVKEGWLAIAKTKSWQEKRAGAWATRQPGSANFAAKGTFRNRVWSHPTPLRYFATTPLLPLLLPLPSRKPHRRRLWTAASVWDVVPRRPAVIVVWLRQGCSRATDSTTGINPSQSMEIAPRSPCAVHHDTHQSGSGRRLNRRAWLGGCFAGWNDTTEFHSPAGTSVKLPNPVVSDAVQPSQNPRMLSAWPWKAVHVVSDKSDVVPETLRQSSCLTYMTLDLSRHRDPNSLLPLALPNLQWTLDTLPPYQMFLS